MFCKNKKGFGILEVVIVVTIFLLTLAGVISITGLAYKNLVKNEMRWKAAIIGQNLIEEKRNKRDTNLLQGLSWNSELNQSGVYYYDIDMNRLVSPTGSVFTVTFSSTASNGVVEVVVDGAGTPIHFGTFLKPLSYY